MLSNNQRKQIIQLAQKKYRDQWQLFAAEGEKNVRALLAARYTCTALYATKPIFGMQAEQITVGEMKKITHLKTPSPVLGVFKIPPQESVISQGPMLALDAIRDPGNLGTIIRLCDWFGMNQLLCSTTTVDCFNPKVIQASMGSIARVSCIYTQLHSFIKSSDKQVIATALEGKSLYEYSFKTDTLIVFGNESHGLSDTIAACVDLSLCIPRFRSGSEPESLNVATAASIFLSEMFREK